MEHGSRWTVRNILLALGAVWAAVAAFMSTMDGEGYAMSFTVFVDGDSPEAAERAYLDAILAVDGNRDVMLFINDRVLTDNCLSAVVDMEAYGAPCDGVVWVMAARGAAVSYSMSKLVDSAGPLREHAHILEVWKVFDVEHMYISIVVGVLSVGIVAYATYRKTIGRLYTVWLGAAALAVPLVIILATIRMKTTDLLQEGFVMPLSP